MPSGQTISPTRSATVNAGCAELVGGHRRRPGDGVPAVRAGTRSSGSSPVAAASTSASVTAPGSPDCAGLRAATCAPATRSSPAVAAVHHVLPTSVPCRSTNTSVPRSGHGPSGKSSASAVASRSTCSAVWAAESATRSRDVPGGTVGGRMAGTSSPRRAGRRPPRARAPRRRTTNGTIGDGCPGRSRSTLARSRATQLVALRASGRPAARPSAAAVSAGVDAVVKMYERARFTSEVGERRRAGDEPAERAEGLRQRADPHARRCPRGSSRRASGPSTACASSSTSSAPWCAHTSASSSTGATSPSIENTVSVTTMARGAVAGRAAARRRGRRRRGGRPRAARPASRRPSMIDAWLSSSEHDEHVGAGEGARARRGWRRTRWGTARRRRSRFQSASSASSSSCTGREPTMRRAAPAPVPQRSMAVVRGGARPPGAG